MAGRLMNTLAHLGRAASPAASLASLGQRYQDYPSELDQNRPPQDIIRELFLQQLLQQRLQQQIPQGPPGTQPIRPGTPSWPHGYTRI